MNGLIQMSGRLILFYTQSLSRNKFLRDGTIESVILYCLQTNVMTPSTQTQTDIFVEMAIKAWNVQISRTSKFLDSLDDQSLSKEIAPGKNRISYLLGHL